MLMGHDLASFELKLSDKLGFPQVLLLWDLRQVSEMAVQQVSEWLTPIFNQRS